MYNWLTAFTLKQTYEKVAELKKAGKSNFDAKNQSQSYNAVTLSVVYGEVIFFVKFLWQYSKNINKYGHKRMK
jgi:acyl-CoA oxidase